MRFNIIVLMFFAVIGVFIMGTAIHELTHKWDLRNVSIGSGDTCILNLPTSENGYQVGYYRYEYDTEKREEIEGIYKYAEWKAYFVESLLFLLVVWAIFETKLDYEEKSQVTTSK